MNSLSSPVFRSIAVAAIVGVISPLLGSRTFAATDAASERLTAAGVIPVRAAGPYVELGTLKIQVSTKLGRPSTILPGGIWLYDNRSVDQSNARGTLVVKFSGGRVSDLALVTPAVAVALREDPSKAIGTYLVANK